MARTELQSAPRLIQSGYSLSISSYSSLVVVVCMASSRNRGYISGSLQSAKGYHRSRRASNGLRQRGLAKSSRFRERFRGHPIETHVLKTLWRSWTAYLCSFPKDTSVFRCVVPTLSDRVVPVFRTSRLCVLVPTPQGPPRQHPNLPPFQSDLGSAAVNE